MTIPTLTINTEPIGVELPLARNSIGGSFVVSAARGPAVCGCGMLMANFLQLDIPDLPQLTFAANLHLSISMCPVHNQCSTIFDREPQLPERFWLKREMAYVQGGGTMLYPIHYRATLHANSAHELTLPPDPWICERKLFLSATNELIDSEWPMEPIAGAPPEYYHRSALGCFKIGGFPSWLQDPEFRRCCCGANMRFICQIPAHYEFPITDAAPRQFDWWDVRSYRLFLGNQIYIFACEQRCCEDAVLVVNE